MTTARLISLFAATAVLVELELDDLQGAGIQLGLDRAPFGVDPVNWLGGGNNLYWIALVSVRLWLQVGFYMILLIAGLNKIPQETYEAAALDGASGWRLLGPRRLLGVFAAGGLVLGLLAVSSVQFRDRIVRTTQALTSRRAAKKEAEHD